MDGIDGWDWTAWDGWGGRDAREGEVTHPSIPSIHPIPPSIYAIHPIHPIHQHQSITAHPSNYTPSQPRIVSRPWQSDHLIGEILEHAIRGNLSPCNLIQNSAELQTWFAEFCKADGETCGDARNLRSAKHRFESYAMPLARVCRHFRALLRVAIKTASTRDDKFGKGMEDFLRWLQPEHVLLLGMLADAGDDALCLTRTFDNEQVDVAEAGTQCKAFEARMHKLFGSSEMCFKAPGFTRTMVAELSKPMVWVVKSKRYSIGSEDGPSHDMKQSCLARMRCWLALCSSTIQAEFPDFALIQVLTDPLGSEIVKRN